MRIAAHTFRNDCDKAELQKCPPGERPEEEIPGALNRGRNGVSSGDGDHKRPFRRRHSVPRKYAKLMCEVPLPSAESRSTIRQTPPVHARILCGAALSYRESFCVLLPPTAPADRK